VTARLRRQWLLAMGEDEEIALAAATQSYALAQEVHHVSAVLQCHHERHTLFIVSHTLDML
jgi:hypothetical protein